MCCGLTFSPLPFLLLLALPPEKISSVRDGSCGFFSWRPILFIFYLTILFSDAGPPPRKNIISPGRVMPFFPWHPILFMASAGIFGNYFAKGTFHYSLNNTFLCWPYPPIHCSHSLMRITYFCAAVLTLNTPSKKQGCLISFN